jgi:hypothetical protein
VGEAATVAVLAAAVVTVVEALLARAAGGLDRLAVRVHELAVTAEAAAARVAE